MLGSPIRTPPDHSSVANSPGLIAGSYVLHRLLMPRHPPCALHSLSHKHSTRNTTTKETNQRPRTPHTTHTQRVRNCAMSLNSRIATRCSRPLFTNQKPAKPTNVTTPPSGKAASKETHTQPRRPSQVRDSDVLCRRSLIPQTPNSVPTTQPPPPRPGSTPT